MTTQPIISVVIPTRDRPELLCRCIDAVLDQATPASFEVIVVNDGGVAVTGRALHDERVRIVETGGRGPAAARNAGIAIARGDIMLFTDDDAIPQPGWIDAAHQAFVQHPHAVGIAGAVESPSVDPLYQRTVRTGDGFRNYLTCNIAYRTAHLAAVGRFDEGFPYPHAEDRDLGERMAARGPILFAPEMVVEHPPHPYTIRDGIRRGRLIESDWRLYLKHPALRPPRWSTRWGPVIRIARSWQRQFVLSKVWRSPRRAARFAALSTGQLAVALWSTMRHYPTELAPSIATDADRGARPFRIALIGGDPERGGGVGGCAWMVVEQLTRLGCEVDCYTVLDLTATTSGVETIPGVRVIGLDTGWRCDRWYSNTNITKVFTGLAARASGRQRLATLLLEQHRVQPYDVIYQFSTIEVFGLRRHLGRLPPLVMHPSTHMAGEQAEVRRERVLAVEVLRRVRTRRQRRDIQLASAVIGISRVFADHLVRDYALDERRMTVIPYPIGIPQRQDKLARGCHDPGMHGIVMISRVSVRKGIDVFIELSRRLGDLAGQTRLHLVGGDTLRSDYQPLLTGLDPSTATYHGQLGHHDVLALLAAADVLVQPATYEPFGLSVSEALACGTPVVATEQIGAAEGVAGECCIIVPAGDANAFEHAVRAMLDRMASPQEPEIRRLARAEAQRLFSPERVGTMILDVLRSTAGER